MVVMKELRKENLIFVRTRKKRNFTNNKILNKILNRSSIYILYIHTYTYVF